jgi:hypothetical protein
MSRGVRQTILVSFAASAGVMLPVAGVSAQVWLRGEREPARGVAEAVRLEGVVVREPGAGAARVIGWDRVRSVEGPLAPEAAAFAEIMDGAWRARSRVERLDYAGAEPLLEELFARYRQAEAGGTGGGPTGAVVDEALMRCRLARGAPGAALWPWLSMVQRRQAAGAAGMAGWIGGTIDRPPIRDAATDLVGALAPMFVDDRATAALAEAPEWGWFADGPRAAAQLAALYRAAAQFEVSPGTAVDASLLVPRGHAEHAGVRLVSEVVAARVGDREQRRAARAALEQRIRAAAGAAANVEGAAGAPAWVEAWCRAAIGRSMLREEEARERRRGVTELLHVPARFGDSLPHLSALALAESAAAMQEMGDAESAGVLLRELRSRCPGHPILEWHRLEGIVPAGVVEPSGGAGWPGSAQGPRDDARGTS